MRRLLTMAVLGALVAVPAYGQMTLVEDFSTYTDGDSLKLVGGWDNTRNSGFQPSAWDPGNIIVEADNNGVNILSLSNQDLTTSHGGDLQLATATGAAYDIPDITGKGTIYMKLKIDDAFNMAIATNGRGETFCDDGINCQSVHDWSNQASINRFELGTKTGPTYAFDARDGGAYVASPTSTFDSDTWYEYWIQIDTVAQIAKYYLRELDPTNTVTPEAMLDAGGSDEWGFRNLSYSSITTLKFNISGSPTYQCDNWPGGVDDPLVDDCFFQETLIADIGVDDTGWTLDPAGTYVPPGDDPCPERGAFGDFNCDTVVGLLDLDILGQNWGATGVTYAEGDANGDTEVGLLDLDILGQHWGQSTPVPEPAALSLLAIGGLLAIRRR